MCRLGQIWEIKARVPAGTLWCIQQWRCKLLLPMKMRFPYANTENLWTLGHLQAHNVCMFMAVQRYTDFGHRNFAHKVQNYGCMHKCIPCWLATCHKPLLTQLLVVRNHGARFLTVTLRFPDSCKISHCSIFFFFFSFFINTCVYEVSDRVIIHFGDEKLLLRSGEQDCKDQHDVCLIKRSFFWLTICVWKRTALTQQ